MACMQVSFECFIESAIIKTLPSKSRYQVSADTTGEDRLDFGVLKVSVQVLIQSLVAMHLVFITNTTTRTILQSGSHTIQ